MPGNIIIAAPKCFPSVQKLRVYINDEIKAELRKKESATIELEGNSIVAVQIIAPLGESKLYYCPTPVSAANSTIIKVRGTLTGYALDIVETTRVCDYATEYRKKCNVCGKVFCYNLDDIETNMMLAKQAKNSAILGGLNAIAGTRYDAYEQAKLSQGAIDKIVDYSRCPECGSSNISDATDEDFAKSNQPASVVQQVSAADELKKFKELLDMGIITQEEFDAKKKQLLGL